MTTNKIIRIDKVTVIDQMELISYDIVIGCGLGSRGLVKESHIERTLVLFNRFKIKLRDEKKETT